MIDIPDGLLPRDAQGHVLCPKCTKAWSVCVCPEQKLDTCDIVSFSPRVRLDKSGRRGKLVTLITGLPMAERFLKDLSKKIKQKTGSGGTFYVEGDSGVIEIQGDHVKIVKCFFGPGV